MKIQRSVKLPIPEACDPLGALARWRLVNLSHEDRRCTSRARGNLTPNPLRGANIGFADILSGAERGSRTTTSPLPSQGRGWGW